MNSMCSSI